MMYSSTTTTNTSAIDMGLTHTMRKYLTIVRLFIISRPKDGNEYKEG
jgi:hypothetical protein